jgi:Gas vesicle synthesis protein GvpL/GvpF
VTLLLYAVTDRLRVSGNGVGAAPLSLVRGSGLAAVVSASHAPAPEPSEQRIWEYEEVVESLMDSGTILPARFGTVLEHEDAVRRFLAQQRDELNRGLERVRGAVEMGVRVQWADGLDASGYVTGESGTAYMLGRLALVRSARGIAERLGPLLSLSRLARVAVLPRRGVAVLAAYLVERRSADDFAERCERLNDELALAALTCTGPWPPYSFASDGERS